MSMKNNAQNWESTFPFLGIDIDNKFQTTDTNFDKVHCKIMSIIKNRRARRLMIQG